MDLLYAKGFIRTEGKVPRMRYKDVADDELLALADIRPEDDYAAVLADGYVLVDTDDEANSTALLSAISAKGLKGWLYKTDRGYHFVLRSSPGLRHNMTKARLLNGLVVDFKMGGIHNGIQFLRVDGRARTLIQDTDEPDILPPDFLPAEDVPAVGVVPAVTPARLGAQIGEGARNTTLFKLGSSLRGRGMADAVLRESLELKNLECSPPLPAREVDIIIEQVLKFPPGAAERVPALKTERISDLMTRDVPAVAYVVEGLLPVGLSILAGPPKTGKSWLALELSLCASIGEDFLRHRTKQCTVLYAALEDSEVRMKGRVASMTTEKPYTLHYTTKVQTLNNGLLEQLDEFLGQQPDTKLIIIDTLQKIRDGGKKGEGVYATDYREVGILKEFADRHRVSVLLVHHLNKKTGDDDPFNRISGTNGIHGAADATFVLTRSKADSSRYELAMTGRDILSDKFVLSWTDFRWQVEGTAEEIEKRDQVRAYEVDPVIETIKHHVQLNQAGWEVTTQEIFDACYEHTGECPAESLGVLTKHINQYVDMLSARDGIKRILRHGKERKYRFYQGVYPKTKSLP